MSTTPTPAPEALRPQVIAALRTVRDPELPVNIYDLGLIYAVHVTLGAAVDIVMTLTAPTCPVSQSLPGEVEQAVRGVSGVTACTVHLVWEPKWTKARMSQAAQVQLDML